MCTHLQFLGIKIFFHVVKDWPWETIVISRLHPYLCIHRFHLFYRSWHSWKQGLFMTQYFFNVCLFWERDRERERMRISQTGSTLSAQSLTWGLNSWIFRSWPAPKIKSWMLNWLSHPGASSWLGITYLFYRINIGSSNRFSMFILRNKKGIEEKKYNRMNAKWSQEEISKVRDKEGAKFYLLFFPGAECRQNLCTAHSIGMLPLHQV